MLCLELISCPSEVLCDRISPAMRVVSWDFGFGEVRMQQGQGPRVLQLGEFLQAIGLQGERELYVKRLKPDHHLFNVHVRIFPQSRIDQQSGLNVRSQQLMKARSRTLLLSKLRGLVLASQVHKPSGTAVENEDCHGHAQGRGTSNPAGHGGEQEVFLGIRIGTCTFEPCEPPLRVILPVLS